MGEFGDKQLCLFRDGGELVPSGSLVEGAEKRVHLERLRECYGARRAGHPGPNPVSIERRQIERLHAQPYLAALKSDGVRYSLLLTTFEGEPRAVMINRSLEVYEVELWANETFFVQPTLFDGELVWESGEEGLRLLFLVFDIVCLRGKRCEGMRYSDRLSELHRHILSELPAGVREHESDLLEQMIIDEDKIFAMNNAYGMRILPKRFVPVANLSQLWQTRGESRHRNDGLVFVKDTTRIATGTDYDMYKWKPENTIDVKYIHERSGEHHLLFLSRGTEVTGDEILFHDEAWAVRLEENKMIQCLIEAERKRDGVLCSILECLCKIHAEEKRVELFPVKCRVDKATPNDIAVVRATLKNIEEGIVFDDLLFSSDSGGKLASVCDSAPGPFGDAPTAPFPFARFPCVDAACPSERTVQGHPDERSDAPDHAAPPSTATSDGAPPAAEVASRRKRTAAKASQESAKRPTRGARAADGDPVVPGASVAAEPTTEPVPEAAAGSESAGAGSAGTSADATAERPAVRDGGVRTRSRARGDGAGGTGEATQGDASGRKRTR